MKLISKRAMRNTRLAYLAMATLATSHLVHAQAADAVLSVGGSVVATTCFVRIDGAAGLAAGASSATLTLPPVNATAGAAGIATGTLLGTPKQFTVGLASAAGGTTDCAISGTTSFQTVFSGTGTQITTIGGKSYLANTATGNATTGVAIELASLNADGTYKQAVTSIPTTPTNGITYSGATNISSQTGLAASAYNSTQKFQLSLIKALAPASAIAAGTVTSTVNINYSVM